MIAAIGPVSVIGAFQEKKVQPRLGMVVESESVLNDGVAAVGFAILVAIAVGGATDTPRIGLPFMRKICELQE